MVSTGSEGALNQYLVANRLRAHPEIRHYAAAGEVLLALKDSFPCH